MDEQASLFDAANTQVEPPPARRWWMAKYVVEWLIALVLLIVLLPVLGLLAVLVKVTSRGPALYVGERLGKGGRVFRLYKFRSMRVDAKMVLGADGKVITADKDPRLTSIGRFLRLGFDELPQLLNVLKGDMCLIGPRPDVPWEMERYTPRQRSRLAVLPGVTGLTQVLDAREMNNAQNYELDVRYVACSSAWTDILSAVVTVPYSFGAKKIGQKAFRRYMQGLEQLADEAVKEGQ
jgi:undecaprenyl phosphate N,N'-diacetylbacillosamine 1-phosphate transferase